LGVSHDRMYLHLETFRKAIATALFHRPFRIRRWGLVLGLAVLFLLFWSFLALGRILDDLLFRAWRSQPITAPVFIVATPRSGTTFLQRLLSLDEERFKPLLLHEMIFSAVVWQRTIHVLAALDRFLGRPGGRTVDFVGRFFFGNWDDRHFIRLDLPEEDEGLYIFTLVTEATYLLCPYYKELPPIGFTDALPQHEADRLVTFFRQSVQRLLFANGPQHTVLTKGTCSLGRIRALQRSFPDARFIHLVRHPAEAIPSHVSMFHSTWMVHSPEIRKVSPETRACAGLVASWYRHMLVEAPAIPEARYVRIMYDDLVADPRRTVEGIYDHFGLTIGRAFSAKLDLAVTEAKSYRSRHQYTLAEYGLDEVWLKDQLGTVLEAYSYPARTTEPSH